MTDTTLYKLNLDIDPDSLGKEKYDSLADIESDQKDADETVETFGYIGDPADIAPRTEVEGPPRTPAEKIDDLFANMAPFRKNFLEILEFCTTKKDLAELDTLIEERQAHWRSVYSAINYCHMLTEAGALQKITAEEIPYEDVEVELIEVERDGQTFIEPGNAPVAFWQTTEEGLGAIEHYQPIKALQEIFEKEARYKGVFQQLLELADQDGGISVVEIKEKVNKNPALDYPHKTAQFFMDYLDRNGAMVWENFWKTTSLGKQALQLLRSEGE